MVHATRRRIGFVACGLAAALLLAAGCGGDDGDDEPGGGPDGGGRVTPPPAPPIEPDTFRTVADLPLPGIAPISTEPHRTGRDSWLMNAGVGTAKGGIQSTLFRSTDDANTWKPIDTGTLLTAPGIHGINAISDIDGTLVAAGVWSTDTPRDDPYLPAAWISADRGDTWRRVMLPTLPRHHGIVNDMVSWEGAIYAVGQAEPIGVRKPRVGIVWRSEDGERWTRVGPAGGFAAVGGRETFLEDIAVVDDTTGEADGGLVVVGNSSSDARNGFSDQRSLPLVLTSGDGADWRRFDLERPNARAQAVAVGGAEDGPLVIGGSAGTKAGGSPWIEVARLRRGGGGLDVVEDRDEARKVVDPVQAAHGITGTGLVRTLDWDGERFVAGVVNGPESRGSLTFWRAVDPVRWIGLGVDGAQPKLEPGRIETLGDTDVSTERIVATGRIAGTKRIAVVAAAAGDD